MPFSQEVVARIGAAVQEKAPGLTCYACGHNSFEIAGGFASLSLSTTGLAVLGGEILPSVILVCATCGHEIFFNALKLGLADLFPAHLGTPNGG
ncbi:MAG: hypothetical protein M3Q30_02040 [Actinomycetota bacterium]|nr:hypothetical protein [Actinomycetota bacterium]